MHAHKCQKTTTCQMSEFGAETIACPWNQQRSPSLESDNMAISSGNNKELIT